MIRRFSAPLIFLILVASCNGQAPIPSQSEAFKALRSSLRKVEEPEAKLTLIETYLAAYPDGEHTSDLAEAVAYYRGDEMKDPAGAYATIKELRTKVKTPETRFRLGTILFPLAADGGGEMNLKEIAGELAKTRPLTCEENVEISDLAISAEAWQEALSFAETALNIAERGPASTVDGSEDLTEEQRKTRIDEQRVRALSNRGWAQANLGDAAAAEESFKQGSALDIPNYLGVSNFPLKLYWGKTLLAEGRAAEALEMLSSQALYGASAEAEAAFRTAWELLNPDHEGFEKALWESRVERAKTIDDFSLPRDDGTNFQMASLRGKTVYLAFWFPT